MLLVFLLTGCATSKWTAKVNSFSTASAPTLTTVNDEYTNANNIHIMEEEAKLVDKYAVSGYHPNEITNIIPDADLKARLAAISALKSYITGLDALTSGKATTSLETGTKATTPTSSSSSMSATTSWALNSQELGLAFQGLDQVMSVVLQAKVKKDLAPVLIQADPYVQQICTLLNADLATLKTQQDADYQVVLMEQSQFIEKNKANLNPVEMRTEVLKLVQINQDENTADKNIVSAQTAIKKLATDHHNLITGDVNSTKKVK